jgi:arsenate reductase
MAEAILNAKGKGTFAAYSAGSQPTRTVRPEALEQIKSAGLSADSLCSKSWEEFAKSGAPRMDFVFTVCDHAANETCPLWPGQPVTAHWGVPDPVAASGTPEQITRAFREAFLILDRRINLLLNLPLASLDTSASKQELDRIGKQ